jgi:hypothetical protein
MVEKRFAQENERVGNFLLPGAKARDTSAHALVHQWLRLIRRRIPVGATVSATVQSRPLGGYLASFKLFSEEELLSSEARAENPEEAVAKAGEGLCQHLPLTESDRWAS